ncbi:MULTISPECIES: alpha/beta fold hydrolase [Allobacillus]|nr:alpha/beta fold hydrolase [Allobacillus salarius]
MSLSSSSISDHEASVISAQTYRDNIDYVKIRVGDGITWNKIDDIIDEDTGLRGYVLQNPETEDIVISFRGTETPKSVEVEQKYVGSPSQDARLAGGSAKLKDGNIVYETKTGYDELAKDIKEDINGIILGNSNYTKKEYGKTKVNGSPAQNAALASGRAKINANDGTISYLNKNQFTEADEVVNKYVEQHGADQITFVGHSLGGGLAEFYAVKYDSHAVTFAAADVFDILPKEDQERAMAGEYKDNIISYTYPDDLVGTYYEHSIGSQYYMDDPSQGGKGLDSHGIVNFTDQSLYTEDGYFLASVLYDEMIQSQVTLSPLALKNQGVHDFHIQIQSELMKSFANDVENSVEKIDSARKLLAMFLDNYVSNMNEVKNRYMGVTGIGNYDQLNASHVEEIFRELTAIHSNGSPKLVDTEKVEDLIEKLGNSSQDTGEIAHHMKKMGDNFEESDRLLAQWLQF